jgi:hypothetical protein
MRRADILFAAFLLFIALFTMYEATDLSIGWIRGMGPGGGAYPFYLGGLMVAFCVIVIIRAILKPSPEPFFADRAGVKNVLVAASIFSGATVAVFIVGVYGATVVLFATYMRLMGKHRWWPTTILVSLAVPIGLYIFFEIGLVVPLPKGYLEPLFY